MLRTFVARGYRNLDTEVRLGRCTVLVGPNNCGKSNLMRALGLAGDGARTSGEQSWARVVRQHGGLALVSRELRESPAWTMGEGEVELRWEASDGAFETVQELRLSRGELDLPSVSADWLEAGDPSLGAAKARCGGGSGSISYATADGQVHTARLSGAFYPLLGMQPSIADVPDGWVDGPALDVVLCLSRTRRLLASQHHLSLADLAPRVIARPAPEPEDDTVLAPDARNLAHYLRNLENEHPDGLIGVATALRELLPELRRIWVKTPGGAGAAWIELVMRGSRAGFPLRDFSDGTVVALLLAALLHGPEERKLLMLDEPELNLHPAWLKVVAGWLQAPTAVEQVVFSTHSTDLLDALTPGFLTGDVAVLVADREAGFRNLEVEELRAFFDDGYELGDLYRMGEPQLGGWPW